jgi:hypothetical protein
METANREGSMRRLEDFTPPPSPEHHGAAIVHLQQCISTLQDRLDAVEAGFQMAKRWGERIAWAAAMALLFGVNIEREQAAELIVKLLAAAFGG